jgi:hypothetical protein
MHHTSVYRHNNDTSRGALLVHHTSVYRYNNNTSRGALPMHHTSVYRHNNDTSRGALPVHHTSVYRYNNNTSRGALPVTTRLSIDNSLRFVRLHLISQQWIGMPARRSASHSSQKKIVCDVARSGRNGDNMGTGWSKLEVKSLNK